MWDKIQKGGRIWVGKEGKRGQMNGLALEKNKMILSEVRAGDKMDKDVPVGRDER